MKRPNPPMTTHAVAAAPVAAFAASTAAQSKEELEPRWERGTLTGLRLR